MNDGTNSTSQPSEQPPAVPPAAVAAPPPQQSPAEAGVWAIPSETAAVLRDIDNACALALQKLGNAEVDYLTAKAALLEELKQRRMTFKNIMDDAARRAGLDIDKQRWRIDTRTMLLVREN